MSTMDKAVEAGAREIAAATANITGQSWDDLGPVDRRRLEFRAKAAIRAALPILAEDLVAMVEAVEAQQGNDHGAANTGGAEQAASALRARIQSMLEGG